MPRGNKKKSVIFILFNSNRQRVTGGLHAEPDSSASFHRHPEDSRPTLQGSSSLNRHHLQNGGLESPSLRLHGESTSNPVRCKQLLLSSGRPHVHTHPGHWLRFLGLPLTRSWPWTSIQDLAELCFSCAKWNNTCYLLCRIFSKFKEVMKLKWLAKLPT